MVIGGREKSIDRAPTWRFIGKLMEFFATEWPDNVIEFKPSDQGTIIYDVFFFKNKEAWLLEEKEGVVPGVKENYVYVQLCQGMVNFTYDETDEAEEFINRAIEAVS